MANGKMGDAGQLIVIFAGVIVAAVILASVGDSVVGSTTTGQAVNETVTLPAAGNTSVAMQGRTLIELTVISNESHSIGDATVSMVDSRVVNGVFTVAFTPNDTFLASQGASTPVNVSYTFQPDGYLASSGARSVTLLITIFGALAVLVFVVVMIMNKTSMAGLLRRQ